MNPGERWAYRARGVDPLVQVEVIRLGTAKPARVKVRFIEDVFEGREVWVPSGRLKTPWADADALLEREARWEGVSTRALRRSREEFATDVVLHTLVDSRVATAIAKAPGALMIFAPAVLAAQAGVDDARLREHSASFEEDGALIVPWPTTEMLMRALCVRNPGPVLRYIAEEEAESAQQRMRGVHLHGTRQGGGYLPPEVVARLDDEEWGAPTRQLLRRWCGTEAVERDDELRAARQEVLRVSGLLAEAITGLYESGARRRARRLEREFGVPLSEALRASRR